MRENIIFYAFRYCLGRKTYVVSDMVEFLQENWNELSQKTKMMIQGEIKTAIKEDNFGMEIDKKEWENLLK